MLKTFPFRSTLRKALPCLLLAVALVAAAFPAPAAHAGPAVPAAAQVWLDGLLDAVRTWMPTSPGLASAASDAGPGMDPNGIEAEAGPDLDPDGLDATSTSDGNSDSEAGPGMDPNG